MSEEKKTPEQNEIEFTKSQQEIIDFSQDNNLLVSASAGSGKTATIIEKIATNLKEGTANIEKMLVVTFTEAASLEMKTRLQAKLSESAENNANVTRALQNLSTADISTLHSFCAKLIRKNFYKLNINAGFGVITGADDTLYKAQALDKVMNKYAKSGDKDFETLCEMFSKSRTNAALKDIVLNIHSFLSAQEDKEKFLSEIATACYDEDLENNVAVRFVNAEINSRMKYIKSKLEKVIISAEQINSQKFVDFYTIVLKQLMPFNTKNTFADNLTNLYNISLPQMLRGRLGPDEESFKEKNAGFWSYIQKSVEKLKDLCVYGNTEQIKNALRHSKKAVDKLLEITTEFENVYKEIKKQKNVLDFSDLEEYAVQLLKDKEVCEKVVALYETIYVDEYQDINPLQERILQFITSGKNMVMVGDVKQSIYGFRNSTPQIFMDKKEIYEKVGGGKVVKLNENFRSNPKVLNFINDIFKVCMTEESGGVKYKEDGMLDGRSEYKPCSEIPEVCLKVITTKKEKVEKETPPYEVYSVCNDDSEYQEAMSETACEARIVAQTILDLLGKNIYDIKTKSVKEIQYKDITILCRTNLVLKEMCLELAGYGIPVFARTNESMYQNNDVLFLLSLLRLVNNPHDDIALTTVLSNPIFKISFNDLAKIKNEFREEKVFYKCCYRYEAEKEDELSYKIKNVNNKIIEARNMLAYSTIYDLLSYFEKEFGFMNFYLMLPNGRKRYKLLTQYIQHFISASYNNDLCAYIDFVDNFAKDTETDATVVSSDNSVRLETIHTSKGLEYPIVFVVGCGNKFSNKSYIGSILKSPTLGLGLDFYDIDNHTKNTTLAKNVIALQIKQDNAMEEMRLLYVALTRAKNHLYIVGGINAEDIEEMEDSRSVKEQSSYLGWILGSLSSLAVTAVQNNKKNVSLKNTSGDLYVIDSYSIEEFSAQNEQADVNINFENNTNKYDFAGYFEKEYKHQNSTQIAQKNTVTNIMLQNESVEAINYQPHKFTLSENQNYTDIDFAKLGTAYHNVLQIIDFKNPTQEYVKEQILKCLNEDKENEKYYNQVDVDKILKCIQEISKFDFRTIIREKQFTMYIPYKEIVSDSQVEDKVLIQGMVDFLGLGDRGNIIIDYKTTRVKNADQLVGKYALQLRLYRQAIEKAMGIKVDEIYICSLYLNKLIKID